MSERLKEHKNAPTFRNPPKPPKAMSKKLTAEEKQNELLMKITTWACDPDKAINKKIAKVNVQKYAKQHAQSRLQAIAEEVEVMREETLDTLRICDPKEEAYIRNDSRQHTLSVVLQIIQQHLEDDNLD